MKRCHGDDPQPVSVPVCVVAGKEVMLDGMEAAVRYQLDSAIMSLSTLIQTRPEVEDDDLLDRLAVGLLHTLLVDEHAQCPINELLAKVADAYNGGQITWDERGRLTIHTPTDEEMEETAEKRQLALTARNLQREVQEQRKEDGMDLIPDAETETTEAAPKPKAGVPTDGGGVFERT